MLKETIQSTRTFRRFNQSREITIDELKSIIEYARLAGSARNCQPWQYILINSADQCSKIFPNIGWAGYLSDWKGPVVGEQPSAYILCLLNRTWLKGTDIEAFFDLGIASQNILLGATELGLGGCRIGNFNKTLGRKLSLKDEQSLEHIIALGEPIETVKIENGLKDGDIKYWRDEKQNHFVPKRTLEDIVIACPEIF